MFSRRKYFVCSHAISQTPITPAKKWKLRSHPIIPSPRSVLNFYLTLTYMHIYNNFNTSKTFFSRRNHFTLFQAEEDLKEALAEEEMRKREDELLLYKSPSQTMIPAAGIAMNMNNNNDTAKTDTLCTCHLYIREESRDRMMSLPTVLAPYGNNGFGIIHEYCHRLGYNHF